MWCVRRLGFELAYVRHFLLCLLYPPPCYTVLYRTSVCVRRSVKEVLYTWILILRDEGVSVKNTLLSYVVTVVLMSCLLSRHWLNAGLILVHCLWPWSNIKATLVIGSMSHDLRDAASILAKNIPSKHNTLTQCWFNASLTSKTAF